MARGSVYTSRSSFLQIVLALQWGTWLGLAPTLLSLQSLLLLLSLIFLNLPWLWLLGAAAASWAAASVFLDPYLHSLGSRLLESTRLAPLWTELFQWPVLPWARFNNSMVLGAFVLGCLALPLWIVLAWKLRRTH